MMRDSIYLTTVAMVKSEIQAAGRLPAGRVHHHSYWSWDGVNCILRVQFPSIHQAHDNTVRPDAAFLANSGAVKLPSLDDPTPIGAAIAALLPVTGIISGQLVPVPLGILPTDTCFAAMVKISSQFSHFHPEAF